MSLVGNQEMFFRSVALSVHQVIHGFTPPLGVKDHSDGVSIHYIKRQNIAKSSVFSNLTMVSQQHYIVMTGLTETDATSITVYSKH